MSKKLDINNIDDISTIIDTMVEMHGTAMIEKTLDGMLQHFNHNLLIDILRRKTKESNPIENEGFIVGLEVYIVRYEDEIKQKEAVKRIADKLGITESTIKSHLETFRKEIRKDIKKLANYSEDIKDVENFIYDFIEHLNKKYRYYNHDVESWIYDEPERKKSAYRKDYKDFIITLDPFFYLPIPF